MSGLTDLLILLALLLFSLFPALGFLIWVRKTERYHTESWGGVSRAFLYGALVGTFVAAILEAILFALYAQVLQPDLGGTLPRGAVPEFLILALLIAPFVEEGIKGLGVVGMRGRIQYVADGMVLGAAVGLGFGFMENLLYGLSALAAGLAVAVTTIAIRSLSSMLIHASATSITGYGVGVNLERKGQGHALAGSYLTAVGIHGSYNALVSLPLILPLVGLVLPGYGFEALSLASLFLAVVYGLAAFGYINKRITEAQFQTAMPLVPPRPTMAARPPGNR
jgi:RsiW-degrading membrane proteinase PrsW (M82 family)